MACGVPVICTAGGSTDDFVSPEFALPIDSKLQDTSAFPLSQGLGPSFSSLVRQMLAVIQRPEITASARVGGPKWVRERYSWKHVVDQLLDVLLTS